jgi:hypothetical protein
MRDGIEDVALLEMLSDKNPALAMELCNTLIINWFSYSSNPALYRDVKRWLLDALE